MAVANNPTTLAGDFKNVYQKSGLVDAVPKHLGIQQRYKFEAAEASTGQYYVFGVVLQREQGFTYAPSSGASSGVQTLSASVAGYIGSAQIEGFAIYLRSRLSYDAAAKASSRGEKAFAQAYGAVLKNMKESHQYRLELSLLYGRDGLGIVSSNTTGALLITSATWATGIWASGMKGAILEAWTSTASSATQHDGDLTISAVDVASKTITVTGTNSSVVQNDILYFKTARTSSAWNECPGIFRILSNAGTLFNIDAAAYELWRAQSYSVNGNLSLTAIMNSAAIGMSFGLEKAVLFCSPPSFALLASDEAALRRYVQSTPDTKRGAKGISFMMGSVEVEVIPHPMVREGHAFMLADESIHRTGATDITFALPGQGDNMSVQVVDATAIELRSMSDMGIFSECPAQCVLVAALT